MNFYLVNYGQLSQGQLVIRLQNMNKPKLSECLGREIVLVYDLYWILQQKIIYNRNSPKQQIFPWIELTSDILKLIIFSIVCATFNFIEPFWILLLDTLHPHIYMYYNLIVNIR